MKVVLLVCISAPNSRVNEDVKFSHHIFGGALVFFDFQNARSKNKLRSSAQSPRSTSLMIVAPLRPRIRVLTLVRNENRVLFISD